MTYDNDPTRRNAVEEDRRLQPDPELDLSGGPATRAQIALTAITSFAIIMLVMYGLTHQRDETAATEPTQTTAQGTDQPASPPATEAQQNAQQQGQQAQGQNQPANATPKQNAPQGETTGTGARATPGAPATGRGDSSQQGAPTQATTPKQQ